MKQEVEAIVKELRDLAPRKPLSGEYLKRAKELMSSLRQMGFTNKEVSELTDGNWTSNTVKLYTRGASRTVDVTPKRRLIDLLNELVKRNIWVNQVEMALSAIRTIEAKGQNLEKVLQFLLSIEESGVDLLNLIEVYRGIVASELTVENLKQSLSYKKKLEGLGITLDRLGLIYQVSSKYGGYESLLYGINSYGEVKAIQDELTKVCKDRIALEENIANLKKETARVEGDIKKLQEDYAHLKKAIELCASLVVDYRLSLKEIEILKKCCESYGDFMTLLEAVGKYKGLAEIETQIRGLSTRKRELELATKELEEKHRRLGSIESKESEVRKTLELINQEIRKSREISIILDLMARPDEIIDPIDKVYASIFAVIKASEAYIEKQSHRIQYASTLKNRLHDVGDLVGAYMTDELRRTRARSGS